MYLKKLESRSNSRMRTDKGEDAVLMFMKKCYALALSCLRTVFGNNIAKEFDAKVRFHRTLNLKNPKTLADKVSWLSVNQYGSLESKCTDKYAVRQYIAEKGMEDILIPLEGGPWDNVSDIDFSLLPSSFMLKATHGCKMGCPVPDKSKLNVDECRKKMQEWMKTTYGTYSMELHYSEIPHRIYAEKLLEDGTAIVDYKIHCLNGKPQFILVCRDRKLDKHNRMAVTLDLFDSHWNPIPEVVPGRLRIPGTGEIPKPILLEEMLAIAEKLSEDFKFVRVDLYVSQNKVLFGELTFTPACGVFSSFSTTFLEEMGELLHI